MLDRERCEGEDFVGGVVDLVGDLGEAGFMQFVGSPSVSVGG